MADLTFPDIHELKRFGFAPGSYSGKCRSCSGHFIADKRAWTCATCASAERDAYNRLTQDERRERYERNVATVEKWFAERGRAGEPTP